MRTQPDDTWAPMRTLLLVALGGLVFADLLGILVCVRSILTVGPWEPSQASRAFAYGALAAWWTDPYWIVLILIPAGLLGWGTLIWLYGRHLAWPINRVYTVVAWMLFSFAGHVTLWRSWHPLTALVLGVSAVLGIRILMWVASRKEQRN